jgi:hypothetical protein
MGNGAAERWVVRRHPLTWTLRHDYLLGRHEDCVDEASVAAEENADERDQRGDREVEPVACARGRGGRMWHGGPVGVQWRGVTCLLGPLPL